MVMAAMVEGVARGGYQALLLLLLLVAGCSANFKSSFAYERDFLFGGRAGPEAREVTLSDRANCGEGDTEPPNRVNTTVRVAALVDLLNQNNYNAYVITSGDEHQSEYAPEPDKRRGYISGFSGSAGVAVVLANGTRALWTDGRYFLQADDELDCDWLFMKDGQAGVPSVLEFLQQTLASGDVVAADAKLIGYGYWLSLKDGLSGNDITMEQSEENLVDLVWDADTDNPRPQYGTDEAIVHSIVYAGVSVEDKLAAVRTELSVQSAQAMVITALDEVAWLYNIRGKDIPYNPVIRSYAIVQEASATLYVDKLKISTEVQDQLTAASVTVKDYPEVFTDIAALSADAGVSLIFLPDDSLSPGCSYQIYQTVADAKRLLDVTPTLLLKAEKNEIEISKMKEALVLDAVALCDFLAFLEGQITTGVEWDELSAQEQLAVYRSQQQDFMDLSFDTISGYGPHGAIIHYTSTNLTNVVIGTDSLYLLDSGGQYLGATTDVTRTLHYGVPTPEMIDMYTRVLQGTIDFASLIFPQGTKKTRIDSMARRKIWELGLDYRHGTSHGIGMYLNVHEPVPDEFKPGYVQSDEPGYYKDGEWGIRIENQVAVVETGLEFDNPFYTFDTMTLVPYEPKLIDVDALTDDQITWLNAQYLLMRTEVGAKLQEQGRDVGYQWLLNKTEEITRPGAEDPDNCAKDFGVRTASSHSLVLASFVALLMLVA